MEYSALLLQVLNLSCHLRIFNIHAHHHMVLNIAGRLQPAEAHLPLQR